MSKITKVNVGGTDYELGGSGSGQLIETTYDNLKSLIASNSLDVGSRYRIIDYVTEYISPDSSEKSAMHPFDIIVTATSANSLSPKAEAAIHEGDEYFADCNLSRWELVYSVNSSTYKKGRIYKMKDEYDNEAPFDFKNIMRLGEGIGCPSDFFYTFSGIDAIPNPSNIYDLSLIAAATKNKILYDSNTILGCVVSSLSLNGTIKNNNMEQISSLHIAVGYNTDPLPGEISYNTFKNGGDTATPLGDIINNIFMNIASLKGGGSSDKLEGNLILELGEFSPQPITISGKVEHCIISGKFVEGDTINSASNALITAKDGTVKSIDLFSLG